MKCADCQHQNAVDAKFCDQCGAPLAPQCANCGAKVAPSAKFCPQCGHRLRPTADDGRFASPRDYTPQHLADRILTSRAAIEGERKQVTVLFADIKGSMEFFAERDPEDVQKLLDPVLERMIQSVHRYEGTVNRVMGDGIMALFGAPLAHEDHAVRACYAALRMQETVARYGDEVQRSHGVPITIRVGLNSGEIVVCAIGNDLHIDYTVVGQTAHLAARMEQMAKPGSVLTTEATHQLAEGYIAMKSLGPVPVKGLVDPVRVYEVTGAGAAQTRLQVAARRGLTRFVGREVELDQLRRAQQAAGEGRGQVVAIVGEPGVGKSRLVHEFVRSHQTADWLVLQSVSASYDHATPYLPIIGMLRQYFEINVNDSTRSIREKVTDKVLALDYALRDTIPPILDLLDVLEHEHPFRALDPHQHRKCTYEAVTRLLLSESAVQPVVAAFGDLHWDDSLTIDLLSELIESARDARLLLVVDYRPQYKDDWANRPNYRQLRLDPLGSDTLSQFLQALLGSAPALEGLKTFLIERANGNPFFVEEMVRSLIDKGVLEGRRGGYHLTRPFSSVEVPLTVQAVLAARIDALPPAEKRLLQEAAVIGQEVSFTLLQVISGLNEDKLRGLLNNLHAAEFVYAKQLFPDLQYTFKHALTHDVAYSGVLRDRRRDIHARVLDAIEELYAGRLGEQVERLAHHAVQGELQEKAVHYLRQAGGKAAVRSALSDSWTWFEQALGVVKVLPESQSTLEQAFEIRLELRPVLRKLGEGRLMLQHLREAESLADQLKDDGRLGRVCAFMTTVLSTLDEMDEALVTGGRALEIARRRGDLKLQVLATSYLEQACYYQAKYEQVVKLATDTLMTLPADWAHEYFGMAVPASVFGRAWLIMSLAETGRFPEAAKYSAEAIRLAEPTEHPFTIAWAHFAASMHHLLEADWVKALSVVERWIAMLRAGNVAIHLPWAVSTSALALAQIGETKEAMKRIGESEQLLGSQATSGIVAHRGWAYHAVSRASLVLGRLDKAQRLGEAAIELCQRQPGFTAHALALLGDIASHPEAFDAQTGTARYREALILAQRYGMRPLIAHCQLGLGNLYRRTGDLELAGENLSAARTIYREIGMGLHQGADATT